MFCLTQLVAVIDAVGTWLEDRRLKLYIAYQAARRQIREQDHSNIEEQGKKTITKDIASLVVIYLEIYLDLEC
jgi:hypothetical protein